MLPVNVSPDELPSIFSKLVALVPKANTAPEKDSSAKLVHLKDTVSVTSPPLRISVAQSTPTLTESFPEPKLIVSFSSPRS